MEENKQTKIRMHYFYIYLYISFVLLYGLVVTYILKHNNWH